MLSLTTVVPDQHGCPPAGTKVGLDGCRAGLNEEYSLYKGRPMIKVIMMC